MYHRPISIKVIIKIIHMSIAFQSFLVVWLSWNKKTCLTLDHIGIPYRTSRVVYLFSNAGAASTNFIRFR